MSSISISRRHKKSPKEARASVSKIAKAIAKRFDIEHEWEDDTLHFQRSGVDGAIELGKGTVKITARLGFLLMALRGPIESEIRRVLDEEFGDD
jgi:putative polyhydroxyalkanoate system protein